MKPKVILYLLIFIPLVSSCSKWENLELSDPDPVTVWIEDIQSTSFVIKWTQCNFKYFSYYEIHVSTTNHWHPTTDWWFIGSEDITKLYEQTMISCTAINRDPGQTYFILVRVYSKHGAFVDSKVISVTTLSD